MGGVFSSTGGTGTEDSDDCGNKKRLRDSKDEKEDSRWQESDIYIPRKKKLKTTSAYIYDKLFLNGEGSDVTIVALGHEFKLHRLYLNQSSYFAGMFSGAWRETDMGTIHMDIPDANIDIEGLKTGLGSLYVDEITVEPAKVVPVLATASLFALESLEQQCLNIMAESISMYTVCSYFEVAKHYQRPNLKSQCFDYLLQNLMTAETVQFLKEIKPALMQILVGSPDLFVIQVEMDVYTMLKKWTYLQLYPDFSGNYRDLSSFAESYWRNKANSNKSEFLLTSEGKQYESVFLKLRFQHIVSDYASSKILEDDKIVPFTWLAPYYRKQWLQMLRVEQGQDLGPTSDVTEDVFNQHSLRCGRVLRHRTGVRQYCWRWTGYQFGMDLLVYFTQGQLMFKRNIHQQPPPGGVSLVVQRNFIYRVSVCSLDSSGRSTYYTTSGIGYVNCLKDQEHHVLQLDENVKYPLQVSCQLLLYTPKDDLCDNTRFLTLPCFQEAPPPAARSSREAAVETDREEADGGSSSEASNVTIAEQNHNNNNPTSAGCSHAQQQGLDRTNDASAGPSNQHLPATSQCSRHMTSPMHNSAMVDPSCLSTNSAAAPRNNYPAMGSALWISPPSLSTSSPPIPWIDPAWLTISSAGGRQPAHLPGWAAHLLRMAESNQGPAHLSEMSASRHQPAHLTGRSTSGHQPAHLPGSSASRINLPQPSTSRGSPRLSSQVEDASDSDSSLTD